MTHRIDYVKDNQSRHRAICSCRTGSPYTLNRQEAEDWVIKHLRLVEQAMAHLRDRRPSVSDQAGYYQSKADDPEETRENRLLWQQLADELKPRLPSTTVTQPTEMDEALPFEIIYRPKRVSRDQP